MDSAVKHLSPDDLATVWSTLDAEKTEVLRRCEKFARWTLPYVCPEESSADADQQQSFVHNGAKYASHLSNRIVDTMFPSDRPFFSLALNSDAELKVSKELDPEELAELNATLRKGTSLIEKAAMRKMHLTKYRPVAVQASEHTVVTGNAALLRLPDDMRVVYGIRDFCVRRDIVGNMLHCILRDMKKFGSLSEDLQDKVMASKPQLASADGETDVTLYTYFWKEDGKWHRVQAVEDVTLDDTRMSYSDVDMPLIVLTWSLSRGDNYARGLVEAHQTLFSQIDVLTEAATDLVGIAADIKFLVNPSSGVDIREWNDAPRGAYIAGREGDVTTPEFRGRDELEVIRAMISELNRELGGTFLSQSAATRDAERVTAEEIRFNARELNTAFGGIYSKLAVSWQQREAEYVISKLDKKLFEGLQDFDVVVTTGVESLSREGQLDDFARAMTDLQLLDAVPEELRAVLDLERIANFIFTNRGASFTDFVLSKKKQQERQQQAQAAQQQQMQMEGQNAVAVEAGKQQAKQE